MRVSYFNDYKRNYYIEQLQAAGVVVVKGKKLHELKEQELKLALAIKRAEEK